MYIIQARKLMSTHSPCTDSFHTVHSSDCSHQGTEKLTSHSKQFILDGDRVVLRSLSAAVNVKGVFPGVLSGSLLLKPSSHK